MDWSSVEKELWRLLLEKDALHIYAAVLIQFAVAKLSRRSLGHLLPWFAVLGIELVNEWIDLLRGLEPELRPWQVVSAVHDIVNTMIMPTVLLLLCRRDPTLFVWRSEAIHGPDDKFSEPTRP